MTRGRAWALVAGAGLAAAALVGARLPIRRAVVPAATITPVAPIASLAPGAPAFIATARRATARYRDQRAAIADGFRRVGVDFPAMGEHWVSLPRIMADSFDAALPSVLIYTRAGGAPTLAGVGYTALLDPGEPLPDLPAARPWWHEHDGSVVDESFAVGAHEGSAHPPHAVREGEPRLAVLHAWVWERNPAGDFATDNWRLPWARLGVEPPRDSAAARAARPLALALGDTEYYAQAIAAAAPFTAAERASIAATVSRTASRLAPLLPPLRARAAALPDDVRALDRAWDAMWGELARALPRRAGALRTARAALER